MFCTLDIQIRGCKCTTFAAQAVPVLDHVGLHRHHNSKRAPSLFTEGEMLLNLGITTNIYRFTTFWSSQAPNLLQAVAISEARG